VPDAGLRGQVDDAGDAGRLALQGGRERAALRQVQPLEAEARPGLQARQARLLQRRVVVGIQAVDAEHGLAARQQPFGHGSADESRHAGYQDGHEPPSPLPTPFSHKARAAARTSRMHAPPSLVALYHAVGSPQATGYRDSLDRSQLSRQLDWLQRRYAIVPLADLLRRRRAGVPLDGLAALTFDDNHRSVLTEALPLLAERRLPATWCLIGGVLAGQGYWRRQVQDVIAAGEVESFLAFARAEAPESVAGLRAERFYRDSKDPRRCHVPALIELLARFRPPRPDPDQMRLQDLASLPPPPGLTLANHSFSHPVFAGLSAQEQAEEVRRGGAAVSAVGWPLVDALALPFGGADSYDATLPAGLAAAGCEALLLTAAEGTAADDLGAHPAFQGMTAGPTVLSRVLLGSVALD